MEISARQALVLAHLAKYGEGWTVAELAKEIGTSPQHVRYARLACEILFGQGLVGRFSEGTKIFYKIEPASVKALAGQQRKKTGK